MAVERRLGLAGERLERAAVAGARAAEEVTRAEVRRMRYGRSLLIIGRMMPAERYSALARVAASAARAVGEAIDVARTDIVKRKRGRANFATAADHAAQDAIVERLAAHDPSIPILGEEGAEGEVRRAERLWVVDPIDGTLNFSRAVPFYCVSIGYVEDGRARAGAIHSPRTGETFVAAEGAGARLNGAPIAVSRTRRLAQAFVVASLAYKAASRPTSRFVQLNAHCARMRMLGSAALEIAYVAAGRFDLFVHGALGPWDIAAGGVIAREAGAAIRSLRTGGEAAWDEPQVIIGPPALVRDALRTIPGLVRADRSPARGRATLVSSSGPGRPRAPGTSAAAVRGPRPSRAKRSTR